MGRALKDQAASNVTSDLGVARMHFPPNRSDARDAAAQCSQQPIGTNAGRFLRAFRPSMTESVFTANSYYGRTIVTPSVDGTRIPDLRT
jgi:CxxC motif-containing protein (DUF1111 family)